MKRKKLILFVLCILFVGASLGSAAFAEEEKISQGRFSAMFYPNEVVLAIVIEIKSIVYDLGLDMVDDEGRYFRSGQMVTGDNKEVVVKIYRRTTDILLLVPEDQQIFEGNSPDKIFPIVLK